MKTSYAFLLLFSLIYLSFSYQDTYKKVVTKNQYSIDIPKHMSETNQLNPKASLQYQNLYDELYVTVYDEIKIVADQMLKTYYEDIFNTDMILAYSQYHLDYYENVLSNFRVINKQRTNVNGLPAIIVTAELKIENTEIIYLISYVKGQYHYYRIETFTLKNYKAIHIDNMFKIIHSFREL